MQLVTHRHPRVPRCPAEESIFYLLSKVNQLALIICYLFYNNPRKYHVDDNTGQPYYLQQSKALKVGNGFKAFLLIHTSYQMHHEPITGVYHPPSNQQNGTFLFPPFHRVLTHLENFSQNQHRHNQISHRDKEPAHCHGSGIPHSLATKTTTVLAGFINPDE